MSTEELLDRKIYPVTDSRRLSLRDLLDHFARAGTMRVSDLHLKVGVPPAYRVDGHLQRIKGPPLESETVAACAAALLARDELAEFHAQRSVDSSYITEDMQFRFHCFYDKDGPAIAIRALDAEDIGFPNDVWRDIVDRTHGLVLVTGITGAGKSTTIAALIRRIAENRACRIVTLEDPIEYILHGSQAIISQREVGRDVPGFARGLRDCLREDPDVIFVGEMRDTESASWTLTAAETGHLVFSTLHTRDARGTVTRVLDMFPSAQQDEVASQLSLGLSHVICQKLVPVEQGDGRVVAMEILHNSYAVSNLIRTRKLEQMYSQLQTRTKDIPGERMLTMEHSLARLVQQGKITTVEAEKWANNRLALHDLLNAIQ
jgi:twitching motility protein PilT